MTPKLAHTPHHMLKATMGVGGLNKKAARGRNCCIIDNSVQKIAENEHVI